MMDIERLTARNKNGLAYLVNVKPNEQEVDSPHKNTLKCILDCFERLAQYEEEAIARQSVTSEEVQRVIDWLATGDFEIIAGDEEYIANSSHHPNTSMFRKTAIIALQAYQPTTRKNRTVEEVAEAIEYVNDWRKESMTFDRAVGILPPTSEETKAYETILTALQAYQPKGE